MKKFTLQVLAAAVFVGVSLANTPVFAAAATATTQVFGVSDNNSLLNFSNNYYYLEATTPNLNNFDAGSSPADQHALETTGSYLSQADATLDVLGPYAYAGALVKGEAHATMQWSFDWTATGTGLVDLAVDYLVSIAVANLGADHALARSYLAVSVDGTSTSNSVLNFLQNQEGSFYDNPILSLSFNVTDGDSGTITITANSDASAVPAPATLWLVGLGLPGLLVNARRKLNA